MSATDPEAGTIFTFILACTVGGSDDGSFNILGTDLRTSAVFDFETKSSYSVTVRVTDQFGLTYHKAFTITVTNQGTIAANGIEITDYIPSGLSFVAASNPTWTAVGTNAKTTIAGPIAPNGTVDVTLILKVAATQGIQGTSLVNRAEISATGDKDSNGNPLVDIDSKFDTDPANDAGGKEGTASDDVITGNGTGTPGDTNAATDEDDADMLLDRVEQSFLSITEQQHG